MQRLPRLTATVFAALLATIQPACAKTHELQPFITLDTTGIGAGASYDLDHGNAVRVQGTFSGTVSSSGPGSYLLTGTNGANPVLLNLSLNQNVGGGGINFTFDHHLKADKPFFVSAGGMLNFIRINADTVPTASSLVFNGTTFSAAELGTLGIRARWRTLNPYLGIGWLAKDETGRQHGAAFELGAFYIGKPTIAFATSRVITANPATFNPYLDSLRSKLSGDLGGLTVYPVLRVRVPVGK